MESLQFTHLPRQDRTWILFTEVSMGIRDSVKNALAQPGAIFLEGPMRDVIEEVLANRGYVMPGDHQALAKRVVQLEDTIAGYDQKLEAYSTLEAEIARVEKHRQAAAAHRDAAEALFGAKE